MTSRVAIDQHQAATAANAAMGESAESIREFTAKCVALSVTWRSTWFRVSEHVVCLSIGVSFVGDRRVG